MLRNEMSCFYKEVQGKHLCPKSTKGYAYFFIR